MAALIALAALPSPSVAATGTQVGIESLLDRRSTAVIDRDRDAFMSTIAPGAGDFRKRQARLFDRLAELPIATYELRAAWERFGDLARPTDRRAYREADAVSIPVTEEYYALEGIDPRPAAEDLFYTYVRRGDEWFIAEDTDLDELTMYSARHLWDMGPVEALPESGRPVW
jgi:hypothetical protein